MPFCEYLISVIVFPLKTGLPSLADGDIPLAYGIFFKTHPKVCLLWRSQGKSMCNLEKCTGATWHGVERTHCPFPGTIISGLHLNKKKPAPEDSLAALQGRHGHGTMLERWLEGKEHSQPLATLSMWPQGSDMHGSARGAGNS